MFVRVNSIGLFGMKSFGVGVEASIENGFPRMDIVGLPDAAVNESKDRVRSAIKNNGFKYSDKRITVNLTPADVRKEGPVYDLPILIALLIASGQLQCDIKKSAFIGELSLSGKVRNLKGTLSMVIRAKALGLSEIYVPLPWRIVTMLCDCRMRTASRRVFLPTPSISVSSFSVGSF